MGYGYGIWLVPKSDHGSFIVDTFNECPFIRHVTVMCKMTHDMALKAYYDLIKEYPLGRFNMYTKSDLIKFDKFNYDGEDGYKDEDITAEAAGWYMEINEWNGIERVICNKKGVIPDRLHMSLMYRSKMNPVVVDYVRSKNDLKKGTLFDSSLCMVDITDNRPWKWKILNSYKPNILLC